MNAVPLNEVFSTIQGEGPRIGQPCVFVRLQHCPIQCPGCDTHYTWDGSETGARPSFSKLESDVLSLLTPLHRRMGVVVSGGEPLLYYKEPAFHKLLRSWERNTWVQLETSGSIGNAEPLDVAMLEDFLHSFTDVVVSPKITPCLHGRQSDDVLLENVQAIVDTLKFADVSLHFKFVCRDEADIAVVEDFAKTYDWSPDRILIMPYGLESEEVIAAGKNLVPAVIRNGWTLTPRLHAIYWGKERKR